MSAVQMGFIGLAIIAAAEFASAAPGELAHRWVYLQVNLQVDENADKAEKILRRAAAAGYNGVVYADFKLNVLDRVTERYRRNVRRIQQVATELNLEIIPCIAPFGYSSGLLMHDPNLAEGLPARNVRFVVKGNAAIPVRDERLRSIPGDFERRDGDVFADWNFQDAPGQGTFADTQTYRSGTCALRVENPPGVKGVNRRVSKSVSLRPYHQYHASVWIKTDDFHAAAVVRLFAIGAGSNRTLSYQNLGVQRSQDWTQHHIVFNSLDSERINLYCGVWGAGAGRLWMDDLVLEESPLVNVVERPGCPLILRRENGEPLVKGRDYQPIVDQRMIKLARDGDFEVFHQPPAIELLPASGLKDGDRVNVDFYHAVSIHDGQVPASITESKCFDWLDRQVRDVEQLLKPRRYFLSHDEIRVANWSAAEDALGLSAGQLLAQNVARCVEVVRHVNPKAKLCVWSDMFDPSHNAREQYYLVKGSLAESWLGLPRDMLIINWNSGEPQRSPRFFAQRGHDQVLAGFYDAPVEQIRGWLQAAQGQRVIGVMYTTWQNDFSQLEAFAKAAWGQP